MKCNMEVNRGDDSGSQEWRDELPAWVFIGFQMKLELNAKTQKILLEHVESESFSQGMSLPDRVICV